MITKSYSPIGITSRIGFTLLELLVVIGIVGVLAGLLIPATVRAKQSSRSMLCKGNLRQLGQMLSGFVLEHKRYPFANAGASRLAEYSGQNGAWFTSIAYEEWKRLEKIIETEKGLPPYSTVSILTCPAVLQRSYPREGLSGGQSTRWHIYGYNSEGAFSSPLIAGRGLGASVANSNAPPVSESEVVQPSEMYAIGDAAIGWNGVLQDCVTKIGRDSRAVEIEGSTSRLTKLHRGKHNVVHCDGHVEARSVQDLYFSTAPEAIRRWNRDNRPN